jgi:hypothetical protein
MEEAFMVIVDYARRIRLNTACGQALSAATIYVFTHS